MRYATFLLALIVSSNALAESVVFPLRDVVVANIRYSTSNKAFVLLKGRPARETCGDELEVVNQNTGPLEISSASRIQAKAGFGVEIPVNLRIQDNNPGKPNSCEIVALDF